MKKEKLPSLVIILILTAITTLFWISFNIYQVFSTDENPIVPDEIIQKISPELDTKTIEIIKTKNNI